MTCRRGEHPNSRANLQPAPLFRPGYDERRAVGAKSAGRRIVACINELCREDDDSNAVYPLGELEKIVERKDASHPKAIAAGLLIACRAIGWDKIDRQPKSLAAVRELLDRLIGKPVMHMDITHREEVPYHAIEDELVALLRQHPDLVATAIEQRPDLLRLAPAETTAEVVAE